MCTSLMCASLMRVSLMGSAALLHASGERR
jgi:hypothetical protein